MVVCAGVDNAVAGDAARRRRQQRRVYYYSGVRRRQQRRQRVAGVCRQRARSADRRPGDDRTGDPRGGGGTGADPPRPGPLGRRRLLADDCLLRPLMAPTPADTQRPPPPVC